MNGWVQTCGADQTLTGSDCLDLLGLDQLECCFPLSVISFCEGIDDDPSNWFILILDSSFCHTQPHPMFCRCSIWLSPYDYRSSVSPDCPLKPSASELKGFRSHSFRISSIRILKAGPTLFPSVTDVPDMSFFLSLATIQNTMENFPCDKITWRYKHWYTTTNHYSMFANQVHAHNSTRKGCLSQPQSIPQRTPWALQSDQFQNHQSQHFQQVA